MLLVNRRIILWVWVIGGWNQEYGMNLGACESGRFYPYKRNVRLSSNSHVDEILET